MISLDENIMSTVWQPGSARTFEISDSGGKLCVKPNATSLEIVVTDYQGLNETVFNQITGQISYQLPYSESSEAGLFLRGDSRTITNQSGASNTQLSIESGAEHPEIQLRYRPTLSYYSAGSENGGSVYNLRIYVVNMNGSDAVSLYGKVPLRISCESTQITRATFNFSSNSDAIGVSSVLDGVTSQVSIPISSSPEGGIINVEVVQCIVKVERSLM
jgi:hypothetical protein